jgi:hypothetical protein
MQEEMPNHEPWIYLGRTLGGGDNWFQTPVNKAITRLVLLERQIRDTDPGFSLDVVFYVPGPLLAPDWVGVRTGSLSRKRRMLQLQVAVPAHIDGKSLEEATEFIVGLLEDAVEAGIQRLNKAKIEFNDTAMRGWMERLKTRLVN